MSIMWARYVVRYGTGPASRDTVALSSFGDEEKTSRLSGYHAYQFVNLGDLEKVKRRVKQEKETLRESA